ncbi:MAG: 4Fe-4S dicluster domain-containing protein [Candidatus Bathyarchaeota archaeon]|nr:MAG: 4Fe-4S dicluster domain-containing protein [Candidatus Bathyarchaeota archaeon]
MEASFKKSLNYLGGSYVVEKQAIWIARDLSKCSGCRQCEVACSLFHEKQVWPEASRIRIFMLVPGADFPHFCAQCEDYPCVDACPVKALSISERTGAVLVKARKCTACGKCIEACPGRVPHLHPTEKRVLICDLCKGKPRCVQVCSEGGWNVLTEVSRRNRAYNLYARTPEDITHDLVTKLYGEMGEQFL